MRKWHALAALVGGVALGLGAITGAAKAGVACYGEASGGKNVTVAETSGVPAIAGDVGFSGFNYGAGIGCDTSIGPAIIGIGARYDILEVDGAEESDKMWSAFVRAGVMVGPGALVYGVAGIAGVDLVYDSISESTQGILLGAGLEFDLAVKNLSFFAEYNHVMWDEKAAGGVDVKPDTDVFRLGLKYKFDLLK